MSQKIIVYWVKHQRKQKNFGDYRKGQRRLADEILNHDLTNRYGIELNREKIRLGVWGKPYIEGMEGYHYNISNTDGMVVCAVSQNPVGVDAERIKRLRPAVLKKCCTSQEQEYISGAGKEKEEERFFQLWTLKESYIKMTGEGMRFPMAEAEFWLEEQEGSDHSEIRCRQQGWFAQRQQEDYWISVCSGSKAEIQWVEWQEGMENIPL